jgi:translation elongation factor EF-Tu-like GTPase
MSFLLLGQTDSGKSTIAGNLLYQAGYFSKVNEELKKIKWSSLLDIEEEIRYGKTKTHEYSYYDFQYKEKNYKLIDTPGHLIYIRSLIEGLFSHEIDLIVLVISSIQNEFKESFTNGTVKEDLLLSRSVGCKNLLVCWNKSDIEIKNENMMKELESYIKKLRFKNVNHIDVSGFFGTNVLSILNFIPEKQNDEEKKFQDKILKKIKTKLCIILPENNLCYIFSKGFSFVLHHNSGEYEAEVINMNKHFISSNGECNACIKLNKEISCKNNDKIILRKHCFTIGYGLIL